MFIVEVELVRGDRAGRGPTLAEALRTVGPVPTNKSVKSARIRFVRKLGASGSSIQARGRNLHEAMVSFIDLAITEVEGA